MNVRYSEIFASFQGEAGFAGTPTIWLRFFGCNLECNGFGQEHPTKPETWDLPYQKIDLADITRFEELPVFSKGCDSSYSWSKRYKHLVHNASPKEVADEMWALAKKSFGLEDGSWRHPKTGQMVQVCFTGGEPMLWQKQLVAVLQSFDEKPEQITIETNGTKPVQDILHNWINNSFYDAKLYFSISPKLESVSGEIGAVDVNNIISEYLDHYNCWLKFVVDGSEACWQELEGYVEQLVYCGSKIWVMPVGATKEDQEKPTIAAIANEGMRRGYQIATRNHTYVYGNVIGS